MMNKRSRFCSFILTFLILIAAFTVSASADNTPVTVSIAIENVLRGATPPSTLSFTFKLTAANSENPMPNSDTLIISGSGNQTFSPMTFSKPGDYLYSLAETDDGVKNYTYDKTVYTVLIHVTSDDNGILSASVYVTGANDKKTEGKVVTFTNTYTAQTTGGDGPKTGDETYTVLLIVLLCVFAFGMLVFGLPKKKKKPSENSQDQ